MRLRSIVSILLWVFIIAVVAMLLARQLDGVPQTINDSYGDATVTFSYDRTWQLTFDDCLIAEWEVDRISGVYLNGDGKIGMGSETFCRSQAPELEVHFEDGTQKIYQIERTIFFGSRTNIVLLFLFSVVVYVALSLVSLMPAPSELWQSYRDLFNRVQNSWQDYWQNEPRNNKVAVAIVILLGFILRLIYIDQPMRLDESLTVGYASNPDIFFTLSNYSLPNNHLFHTLLLYIVRNILGSTDEWVVRIPVFITGIAVVGLTYLVGRRAYHHAVGLIAATLTAISTPIILFSTNARGYIIQTMLLLVMVLIVQSLIKRRSIALWMSYGIIAAIAFYTLPTSLYVVAGISTWVVIYLFVYRKSIILVEDIAHFIQSLVLGAGLTLLLHTPAIAKVGLGGFASNQWTQSLSMQSFLNSIPDALNLLFNFWIEGMPFIVAILFFLTVIIGLILEWRIHHVTMPRYLIVFILTLIGILAIQRPNLFAMNRITLYLLPFVYLASATGIYWVYDKLATRAIVSRKAMQVIGVLLIAFLGFWLVLNRSPYVSEEGFPLQNAEELLETFTEQSPHTSQLYFTPLQDHILRYYANKIDLSQAFFERRYDTAEQVFFIVKSWEDAQHIEGEIRYELGSRTDDSFSEAVLVESYEFSELYRLDRIQSE